VRYLVTKRRNLPHGSAPSALDAVSHEADVKVVSSSNPDMVTIDTDDNTAARLRQKLESTHFVEPEVRRGLH
jgi:hypothetical protein